ncbi:MAG: PIN domain nuclease [Candidatus Competibacteraceae bacterium]|nr:PIN domain nuclease [Candidatus Competibacteraceae bacterium]
MLVDTSVWIDYFNGYASAEADRLAQAISDHESIILCSVVMTEILLGLRSDAEATRIAELQAAFTMAPEPDRMDYCEAATLYRRCRSQGSTIRSTIDCLIARICLRHDYDLLTKDRDFRLIADCYPLRRVI